MFQPLCKTFNFSIFKETAVNKIFTFKKNRNYRLWIKFGDGNCRTFNWIDILRKKDMTHDMKKGYEKKIWKKDMTQKRYGFIDELY